MPKIETICPVCNVKRQTKEEKHSPLFGGSLRIILSCGHSILKRLEKQENVVSKRDEYWDKLMPFQKEGVEFIEKAGFKALVADDMGLGKTVQALLTIRYHRNMGPFLYIVKSAVKYQWQKQIMHWLKDDNDMFFSLPQIVLNGQSELLPLQHTIISMDMLEKFKDQIIERGFKTIIIDESQNFKSMGANRTSALVEIVESLRPEGIICLSGTPILNRASEFFTTLNLLRPHEWRYFDSFVTEWCSLNVKGNNIGGIRRSRREEFHHKVEKYIIRREKRDVLTELPPFRRDYEWILIEDDKIKNAYNNQLKELQKHLTQIESLKESAQNQLVTLGFLEKLRQIAAMSKIPWIMDYVVSFLTVEENEKIVIGLHHEIVIEALREALSEFNPIVITGKDSAEQKSNKVQQFKDDPTCRIGLLSILAAGEGLDGLQHVCSNMVTVERMWNIPKEHQFEARLDRYGQTKPVRNILLLAKGTVDEYFTETVLEKDKYVVSAVSQKDIDQHMEEQFNSLNYKELAEKCAWNLL